MRLLPCSCEGLLTWALLLLLFSESHEKQCKIPVLENGKVESSGDFQFGEEVKFICDGGYRLLGPDTTRCVLYYDNTVDWDKEAPYCERIPCERPPTISSGTHDGDTYSDHYTVGSVVTYTCNKDFSLIGDPTLECVVAEDGKNGKWNRPAPECRVVQCSRPEIENGKLTSGFQASYPYRHTLQYVCDPGYTVLKSEFIECVANSSWYPDPKCVKEPGTTTVPLPPGRNETSRTTPSPGIPVSTVDSEKSLNDRLDSIEKKLDQILLTVSQSCYQQARGGDEQ